MAQKDSQKAADTTQDVQTTYNRFQDILSDEEFDELSEQYGVKSERERKLWLKPFFWLMVLSSAESGNRGSLLQLIGFIVGAAMLLFPEKKITSLTKGAVSQRLQGTSWYFFRGVYNHLLNKYKHLLDETEKQYLDKFKDVYAIDSSVIGLCKTMGKIFASVHKTKSSLKLNTKLSICTGAVTKLQVSNGKRHDSRFFSVTKESNVLYLLDLGYWSFGLMQKIIDAGSFFVMRLKGSCNPKIVRVLHPDYSHLVGLRLSELGEHLAQQTIIGHIDLVVHLSSAKKPRFQTDIRLVGLYHEEVWRFYITNIFDPTFTPQLVYELYALRWQVEIFFNIIKNVLNLKHIISRNKNGIMVEIYSVLIFHLLTLIFIALAARRDGRSIHEFSFERTFKVLRGAFLAHLFRFLQPSLSAVDDIFHALIDIVANMGLATKPPQTFAFQQHFNP